LCATVVEHNALHTQLGGQTQTAFVRVQELFANIHGRFRGRMDEHIALSKPQRYFSTGSVMLQDRYASERQGVPALSQYVVTIGLNRSFVAIGRRLSGTLTPWPVPL